MRNLSLIVLVSCLSLVSCKKKYTCTCYSPMTGKWIDTEIEKSGKAAAKKKCDSFNGDITVDGSTDCHLK